MGTFQKIARPGSSILLGVQEVDARPTYKDGDWCDHLYLKDGFCTTCGRTERECIADSKSRSVFEPRVMDGENSIWGMSIMEVLRRVAMFGGKVRREHNPEAKAQDAANPWRPAPDFPDKKK